MSEWVETHLPCPSCGSSDALSVNSDGWGTCFSCEKRFPPDDYIPQQEERKVTDKALLPKGETLALRSRKIHADTCAKFGYTVGEFDRQTVQIAPYYDADGHLVAQKLRFANKSFTVRGDLSKATLFGQKLWGAGGKQLVITEGEIDALSYSQATNLSWPVVSVPNGAAGAKKAIRKSLEWIESYDRVVFMFDNDEAGLNAANACAELITPGKACVAHLPLKDPNEMLVAGDVKAMVQAAWNAKPRRPDGIVNGADLWDAVSTPVVMGTPYPWKGLNDVLYGLRPREIVTLSAGSGIGKSQVCAEIAYDLAVKQGIPVGYVALEEGCDRTGLRFMGLHVNQPLHLPTSVDSPGGLAPEDRESAFQETLGTGRIWLYDHFGSLDSENLLNKLRYMVLGLGVKFLFLDHLSIVISGMDLESDERRAIDHTMTELRSFTEQTGASLVLVSHLKRPDGRGHEDGAVTSLSQLRGSAAIAQLSDAVVGLERNQQETDALDRNTLTVRVLKNRYAGVTGVACHLRYDNDTSRLTPVTDFDNEAAPSGWDAADDFEGEF